MSDRVRFPLVAKMLVGLSLYLLVLAGAFLIFLNWQLDRGLDSILSGAAAERLEGLGGSVASELRSSPEDEWEEVLRRQVEPYPVEPVLILPGNDFKPPADLPGILHEKIRERVQPPPRGAKSPPPGRREPPPGPGGPPAGEPDRGAGEAERGAPAVRALFLVREQGEYWAAVELPLFEPRRERPRHGILLLRSESISAGGLFFDVRPWILGGLAVLGLSLVIWTPFAFSITRYVSRLSTATNAIARGDFEARVGARRSDELGALGVSIEQMAARLDRLVRGQKRFLGDVAHELCAPLARLRTGLGVLEHGIADDQRDRLASIDADAEELSDLIAEVLSFTRASTAPGSVKLEPVELSPLVREIGERECPGHDLAIDIGDGQTVQADRRLLARVLANLFRNAHAHGGDQCRIAVGARRQGPRVAITVADDGPGVPAEELAHLFEPFYRPDSARTREQGGAGLGMAIVRAGVEACGGSVSARQARPTGLAVELTLNAGAP